MSDQPTTKPTPQAVADRWAERLMNLIKAHGQVHLLLDRFNGLDERLLPLVDPLPEQWPLTDPYFGKAIERTPLLVKLTMAQLPLLDQTALVAAEAALDPTMPAPTVCAWMCTDVSTERLAGQLRQHLNLRMEGRKESVYFCYFDPWVMQHLPRVLAPAQLARLLGAVSLWALPGRNGELLELAKPEEPMAPLGGLRLNLEQAQALERIDPLNASLRLLLAQGRCVPHTDNERLNAFVGQAQHQGLAQADDQATYAALSYIWPAQHPALTTDERMLRGIELARAGLPLADYLQQNPSLISDAHTSDHP